MDFLCDFSYPPTMTDLYAPEKESNVIKNAIKYSNSLLPIDQWSPSTTVPDSHIEPIVISEPSPKSSISTGKFSVKIIQ